MKLTDKQLEFLRRLRDGRTLCLADREEDRARQFCRRRGFAECVMNPRRWVITEAGRDTLRQAVEES